MLAELANVPVRWNHDLEDIMGLVFVSAVVGAYSLLFAFTRRPWRGWAITALVSFGAMAVLIGVTPSRADVRASAWAEACPPAHEESRTCPGERSEQAAPGVGGPPLSMPAGARLPRAMEISE